MLQTTLLKDVLDQHITRRQLVDTDARDNSKFRVSDAGKCQLMRYWKRQGKPGKLSWPLETLRTMQLGITLHEYIQRVLAGQPGIELLVTEQHLEDEHRIGHFDIYVQMASPLIDDMDTLRAILYDLKTKGSKQWFYFEKNDRKNEKIHEYQLVSYWLMAKRDFPVDVCRIAYINRDTFEIHENDVCYEHLAEEVEQEWKILITAWEKQEAPAPNPGNWECKYCMYHDVCEHAKGYIILYEAKKTQHIV